jgi:hypothetical protein
VTFEQAVDAARGLDGTWRAPCSHSPNHNESSSPCLVYGTWGDPSGFPPGLLSEIRS